MAVHEVQVELCTEAISEAKMWAEHAYLRSCISCTHQFCRSFTVEEALFMCMFELWRKAYGPGWWFAIDEQLPIQVTGVEIVEGVCR